MAGRACEQLVCEMEGLDCLVSSALDKPSHLQKIAAVATAVELPGGQGAAVF